ncbi:MAG: cytochrome c3 family protein [Thermodesulfobacteriota bacterium]|nr:cytochrome c3 family protein [Thermodesulfobacteriota bacterium]
MVFGVAVWVLTSGGVASASVYTDSAHGNADPPPGYGVNRSGTGYDIGACTNCHDTFDESICGVSPLMLFSTPLYTQQNTGFCLECHKHPDTSAQVNMPSQRSYTYKFGGDTTNTCPGHIKQAFNFIRENGNSRPDICGSDNGSAHHLTSIRDFLQNRWGFSSVLADINPCEGCHNPHKAQQHYYPVGIQGTSPISLPSTHAGSWDVYGTATTERMDSYAETQIYLAPYYYDKWGEGKYEPDGTSQQYGANMPDYVTFCTDCHNESNDIYSNRLGRNLHKFSWDTEKHGRAAASDGGGYTDFWYPYYDNQSGNYVLSCTDCHETHGSPNPFLIRPRINDRLASIPGGEGEWADLCENCHMHRSHSQNPPDYGPHYEIVQQGYCSVCHIPGDGNHPCTNCHYHGGTFTTWADTYKTF